MMWKRRYVFESETGNDGMTDTLFDLDVLPKHRAGRELSRAHVNERRTAQSVYTWI
jgi:hypothetical protein